MVLRLAVGTDCPRNPPKIMKQILTLIILFPLFAQAELLI